MALPIWQRTITDNQGNVIPGAEVLVVVEATGLEADIFSNRDGTTPRTNPFFTGSDGFAQFYAAPGEYRIEATGPTGSIVWRWNVLVGDVATRSTGTGEFEVPTNAVIDARIDFFTATVEGSDGTSDWSQVSSSDPFIATITVSGIQDTDNPIVDIDLSGVDFEDVEDVQADWALVYRVEASANNQLKLYATDEPTENFDLSIKVVR